MNTIVKVIKHFNIVNKHRWYVFTYSIKAGIPFRGLIHDLSKYSFTEFFESAKYYRGDKSAIHYTRLDKGYSEAWLHHKGRNKHHFEYWEDTSLKGRNGVFMPYKYVVECICDKLAACKAYNKKNFNDHQALDYWNKVDKLGVVNIHPGTSEFVETVLTKISDSGINAGLNKKYLKETYNSIYKKYITKKD